MCQSPAHRLFHFSLQYTVNNRDQSIKNHPEQRRYKNLEKQSVNSALTADKSRLSFLHTPIRSALFSCCSFAQQLLSYPRRDYHAENHSGSVGGEVQPVS